MYKACILLHGVCNIHFDLYKQCLAIKRTMHKTVNININLASLLGELQQSLQHVICLVGAGLQHIDQIDSNQLHIPTDGIKLSLSRSLGWDDNAVRKKYLQWVLANGFRDSIESLSMFLESTHKVLSAWELVEKQKKGIQLKGSDWNEIIHMDLPKYHRLGFPDKLGHLKKEHSIVFNEALGNHVLSINKARNCLVHRCGIVTSADMTSEKGLSITYRRMAMFVQNAGSISDLRIGQVLEKDSVVVVKNQDEEMIFGLGDRIELNTEEISGLIWCLFLFGKSVVQKVENYGFHNGLISRKENMRAGQTCVGDGEDIAAPNT